tara:strand:+ start:297 stop:626 length:330 start_codon:yes stop_codon:yes gene_type:complete
MEEGSPEEYGNSSKLDVEENMKSCMQKNEDLWLSVDEVTEKNGYHSTLDVIALKTSILEDINEYQRKLELGREVKRIVNELNTQKVGLRKEFVEALELFEKQEYEEWRG